MIRVIIRILVNKKQLVKDCFNKMKSLNLITENQKSK